MTCILIVEDDADNRDLVASILAFHGYDTLRAANGRQAVEIAKSNRPDLIMMDISMPIQNGIEATLAIKGDPTLAHIPIVAMSAYDTREDEIDALAAGCVAFFPKPLELFKLKDVLDDILRDHGHG